MFSLLGEEMQKERIPVCLIVGFLGSGKTTLLKHIIRTHAGKRLAFVVNEFSSMDVDGEIIHRDAEKVICLAGGSVFCKCLAGQFIQTLKGVPQALHLPECDGVIVEASGIADPGVATQMLFESGLDALYILSKVVAVVDPGNISQLLAKLPNSKSQLIAADVILLNKNDVYSEKDMDRAENIARTINTHADVYRTSHCGLDLPLFEGKTQAVVSGNYAVCADPNFFTITVNATDEIAVERLLRAINAYEGSLYRAKGFLKTQNGPVYLDWTPSTATRFDLPAYQGKLGFVLIGPGDKAASIKSLATRMESGAFSADKP